MGKITLPLKIRPTERAIMSKQQIRRCIWSFDDFTLDIDRGCVARNGRELKLRPQSFAVLAYLVQHHGVLVPKQDLQDEVWGNKAVTDDSLTHCLVDIRRALGDAAHTMIRTVPRRGYIFQCDVAEPALREIPGAATVNRWRRVAAAAAIFGLSALWFAVPDRQQNEGHVAVRPNDVIPNSIAVLPFDDMTVAQNQTYFAHGMSEEIISLLSGIDGLRVIARTSSFAFQGQNIKIDEIARQLNVSHVLEGSVRKTEDNIRVHPTAKAKPNTNDIG